MFEGGDDDEVQISEQNDKSNNLNQSVNKSVNN